MSSNPGYEYRSKILVIVLTIISLVIASLAVGDVRAAATITATRIGSSIVSEGEKDSGSAINITVSSQPPTSEVTLTITASSSCGIKRTQKGNDAYASSHDLAIYPGDEGLTFGIFSVYGAEDSAYDPNDTCNVNFITSSADSAYDNLSIPALNFSITNNDPEPTQSPAPQPATTTTVTNTTDANEPPKTPEVKLVDVEGEEIATDESDSVLFEEGEDIILSGSTVPNGIVKLYIFSEPQEDEVTADKEGNWSYVISGLEPGEHRVEVEVTDPETNLTSERTQVLAFTVSSVDITDESLASEVASLDSDEGSAFPIAILLAFIGLVILAGVGFWFYKKKSNEKESTSTTPTSLTNMVDEPVIENAQNNTENADSKKS